MAVVYKRCVEHVRNCSDCSDRNPSVPEEEEEEEEEEELVFPKNKFCHFITSCNFQSCTYVSRDSGDLLKQPMIRGNKVHSDRLLINQQQQHGKLTA